MTTSISPKYNYNVFRPDLKFMSQFVPEDPSLKLWREPLTHVNILTPKSKKVRFEEPTTCLCGKTCIHNQHHNLIKVELETQFETMSDIERADIVKDIEVVRNSQNSYLFRNDSLRRGVESGHVNIKLEIAKSKNPNSFTVTPKVIMADQPKDKKGSVILLEVGPCFKNAATITKDGKTTLSWPTKISTEKEEDKDKVYSVDDVIPEDEFVPEYVALQETLAPVYDYVKKILKLYFEKEVPEIQDYPIYIGTKMSKVTVGLAKPGGVGEGWDIQSLEKLVGNTDETLKVALSLQALFCSYDISRKVINCFPYFQTPRKMIQQKTVREPEVLFKSGSKRSFTSAELISDKVQKLEKELD